MSDVASLRVYNMDIDCRESLDRSFAAMSWYVPELGVLPSYAQGFVVCSQNREAPIAAFYAFPYRKHSFLGFIPTLRASRPLIVNGEPFPWAVQALVAGLREFGRDLGAKVVELEAYTDVRASIFFPSSPSAVDGCNDPALARALTALGLAPREVTRTFQVIPRSAAAEWGPSSDVVVRPALSGNSQDKETYYRLWAESGALPLCDTTRWLSLRPWYEDLSPMIGREEYILFAEVRGVPVGFIHWWPNLYKIVAQHGRAALFASINDVPTLTKDAGEGKIFKLAVSKRAGKHKSAVSERLLLSALRLMSRRFGVRSCQVSGIQPGDAVLAGILERMGASMVHEVGLFELRA